MSAFNLSSFTAYFSLISHTHRVLLLLLLPELLSSTFSSASARSISRRWADATSSLPTHAHSQSLHPPAALAFAAICARRSALQMPADRSA